MNSRAINAKRTPRTPLLLTCLLTAGLGAAAIQTARAQRVFPDGIALQGRYVEGLGLVPITAWGGVTNDPVSGMMMSLGQLAGVHPETGEPLNPTNWLPTLSVHTAVVMAITAPPGYQLTLSNLTLQGDGYLITNLNLSSYNIATGTPLYAFTETDPTFTNWLDTNTYIQTETDPVFLAEKSSFATGTPLYVESDPVFLAERSNFATGTPIYVESDPTWVSERSNYATGTPLYAFTESDPVWATASNAYYLRTQSDSLFLRLTNNLNDLPNPQTARSNLQLGTLATQNLNAVRITGGTIQEITLTNVNLLLSADDTLELDQPGNFGFLTEMGTHTLQLGGAESKVLFPGNIEVLGTQTIHHIASLTLSTNHIILNKDGSLSTVLSAGLLIEQDGLTSGYYRVSPATAKALQLKAPAGSNLLLVVTNQDATLTIRKNVSLPDDFVSITSYQSETNAIWQKLNAAATGTPLYVESDPVWTSERSNYATGTPIYAESDPIWTSERSNYATGTPLYAFTELDPAFTNWLDTNTYVQTESDPVWASEKANYATGTPLYVYTETDPVFLAQKAQFATGTPLYVES
ncbi:MAG: hypothetical protein PHP44_15740, partial [Kiritimatiellae bacterium]|nr:hypothetical protein [Kiritimatiellia bacterium]